VSSLRENSISTFGDALVVGSARKGLELYTASGMKAQDARCLAIQDHRAMLKRVGDEVDFDVPDSVLNRDSPSSARNTKAYLAQAKKGGLAKVSELKTLIVGPGGVGKTSLTNALLARGKRANLTGDGDDRATIGVDVSKLTFGNNGKMFMWDFGGQEEYYMTHSFFLSNRCLVMVVVDLSIYTDEGFEEHAGTWIRSLQVHITDPYITVVGTKADLVGMKNAREKMDAILTATEALLSRLQSSFLSRSQMKFSNPKSFIVSGSDVEMGDSVEELYKTLERLASDTVSGVAMRMPKSYAKLRKSLEAKAGRGGLFTKGRPETSILLLSDVQSESGLDDDALATGLSLLHDLGVILWYEYSSTLRDYVFANPGWIVDLIRSVFRHDLFYRPETKGKGTLYDLQLPPKALYSLAELQKKLSEDLRLDERLLRLFPIWKDLDPASFDICVNLMQEFDLMYMVPRKDPGDPAEYLVPLFLRSGFHPDGKMRKGGTFRKSLSHKVAEALKRLKRRSAIRTERQRVYKFPVYIPAGLFFRFVARWHRLATYKSTSEHELQAVVEFLSAEERPVYILIEESVERDGSGEVRLRFWVESSATEDVANLDRTVRLFLAESDEVLEKFFSELPFTREEFDIGGKLLAKTAEEARKFEDMLFASQELSELQMAKPVYKFKVALNDALDHQLKMANKSTNEILEVALAQLRALHLKTGKMLSDPFPLHDRDVEVREALIWLHDQSGNAFASRETVVQLCQIVRRLSSRLRTDFDVFLSHSWGGEGDRTHDRVVEIGETLQDRFGIKSWLDKVEAWQNLKNKITNGIDASQVFGVCVTESYVQKMNVGNPKDNYCGFEYTYAESHKRADDFATLVLEESMKDPMEWNNMGMLSGEYYFDLVASNDNLENLVVIILDRVFPWDEPNDRKKLLEMYPAKGNSENKYV